MKIKKIAIAALVPAAVTGITLSGWAAVEAATGHPSGHSQTHQLRQATRHAARLESHRSAHKRVNQARPAHAGRVHAGRVHADHGAHAHRAQRAHAEAGQGTQAQAAGAPTAQPTAPSTASLFAGMSSFERCVAWRESGDNPTASSAGLFGILPSTWASLGYSGTAGQASVAEQMAAFNRLYAQYGPQPWAQYDGC